MVAPKDANRIWKGGWGAGACIIVPQGKKKKGQEAVFFFFFSLSFSPASFTGWADLHMYIHTYICEEEIKNKIK